MATKPTKLQDEQKKQKAAGLFATALAMLGIGGAGQPTAGKMKRVTETTKHVTTEEEKGGTGSEEEEESDAEEEGSTGSIGSDGDSTGSTHPSEEEEEESGAEEEESEEKGTPMKGKRAGKSEEEEEKSFARAVGAALNSPSVHAAFVAALPKRHREAGAIFSPHRLAALAKKATNARTTYGAMMALSDAKELGQRADAKMLDKLAKLETRTAKVEGARKSERVAAIVDVAKSKGVAGATTHDGRVALREFGMKHGTSALTRHLASMPVVARTSPRTPKEGASAPSGDAQMSAMLASLTTGITDEAEIRRVTDEFTAKMAAMRGGSNAGTET